MRAYENPILPTRADGTTSDPHVTRYNGYYYHCFYRTGGVYVSKVRELCDLSSAEEVCVFPTPTEGLGSAWYAPELHLLDGVWYIYGAPTVAKTDRTSGTLHTMCVLENRSPDPQAPYTDRGAVRGLEGVWSIDGSILEHGGERYFLWTNCRTLYMTKMSSPTSLCGEHIPLMQPTLPFETKVGRINEGPAVLYRNGKVHIVFSANDSRCDDYCLGLLTFSGGEITNPAHWKKHPVAVFEKTADVFGPGHCSFTTVTEGDREVDYIVYHANLVSGSGWEGRSVWAQPFAWNAEDFPVFGAPQKYVFESKETTMSLLNRLPSPAKKTKAELLSILLNEEFGALPPPPLEIRAENAKRDFANFAGKAKLYHATLRCIAPFGEFAFPFSYTLPKVDAPVPALVHINFRPNVPDFYQPTEELIDRGHAVLSFDYRDVTSDDGDFGNGLAGVVYPDGKQTADGCGKIGLWAWAALRLVEFARTLPEIDPERISVAGHSRLGKTALLAGALDERLFCAFSNDSGCGGAALARDNDGETVKKITATFPYWFSLRYRTYAEREEEMPFDQHFLLAANLPHRVYVASASDDAWACPRNEHLSAIAASPYYEAHGLPGLCDQTPVLPAIGTSLHGGWIGYHIRRGLHYFSREDWNRYLDYLEAEYQK